MLGYSDKQQAFIEVNKIAYTYPQGTQVILDMTTKFYPQQFTAIVGSNGSGKTTLGKLLAGIFKPTSGQVLIAGKLSTRLKLGEIGQKVGYLFQEPERQIFAPSVREEIGFVLNFRGVSEREIAEKVAKMLNLFHLAELKDEYPFRLSRGEKQRLALAAILVNEPIFLILDEPTTGLDLHRREELSQILQELKLQGLGLVVISHDEDFVNANADRVLEISGGEIIADQQLHPNDRGE